MYLSVAVVKLIIVGIVMCKTRKADFECKPATGRRSMLTQTTYDATGETFHSNLQIWEGQCNPSFLSVPLYVNV